MLSCLWFWFLQGFFKRWYSFRCFLARDVCLAPPALVLIEMQIGEHCSFCQNKPHRSEIVGKTSLFVSSSDCYSVFFKLNKIENKHWDGNAVYGRSSNIHWRLKKSRKLGQSWEDKEQKVLTLTSVPDNFVGNAFTHRELAWEDWKVFWGAPKCPKKCPPTHPPHRVSWEIYN